MSDKNKYVTDNHISNDKGLTYNKDGYIYYRANDEPVLNKDGSHRKAAGRPVEPEEVKALKQSLKDAKKLKDKERIALYRQEIESRDLMRQLNARGFDVVGRMIDMIDDPNTSEKIVARMLEKMFDKLMPALSAMNVNADNSSDSIVFNFAFSEGSTAGDQMKKNLNIN